MALVLFALANAVFLGALLWAYTRWLARAERRQQQAVAAALASSEERTRLIVEAALDAVVTIDRAGLVTGWNARAEALFGWTRAEITGRTLGETIIPARHAEAHQTGMQRFLETGESRVLNRRVELSAMHRDGREFPIEIAITPMQGASGIAFCAFVRDITERHEALLALQESERRFRSLAESLPQLVWTCRPDGWCDYLSRQWVEYTGQPEAEQLGSGWAEYLHPDDRARVQDEWAAAAVRGDYYDTEFRIRRHDGVYRWFRTRALPLRDGSGSVVKWFGSNTDIEDYKRSQQTLRMQIDRMHLLDRSTRAISERQDLRSIFAAVLDSLETGLTVDFGCICTHDAAGEALILFSVGAGSRSFLPALDLSEGARIPIYGSGLARAVTGLLVYEPELGISKAAFARRLGQAGLGALVLAPLTVEDRVFGLLVAARREPGSFSSGDCEFLRQLSGHVALAAHQAELYSSLQSAYDDLRRTQQAIMQQERLRALGQMSSGIAHDINNALTPAAIYLQSMLEREPGLSDEAREQLRVAERAIASVAQTIARLREFYREREPEQAPEPVDPNRAIEQAVELTRVRWHDMPQQRGIFIELVMDLTSALPAIVGTASELRDALTNLIINAVDAMPHGGRLTLRSRLLPAAGGSGLFEVELAVCDTGTGMSSETRNRCMEPFYTTKGERGTGLGLAMVYGMLERHGARAQIDSEPARGTEMRLLFPLSRADARTSAPAAAARPPSMHILLVDDDPVLLRALREVLETDGHRVVAVDSGQAGIDALRGLEDQGQPCTVVVTDLGMPHVDGLKVAAAAKALRNPPPVILLTGWGQRLLDDGETPPHIDRVLGKPPKLAELRATLAALVQ